MKNVFTLVVFFLSTQLAAQNFSQSFVDSLKQVIANTDEDSVKVNCYIAICGEFYFYSNDSILHYASKIADLAETNNNKDYLATSDTEIGTAYWEKSEYDKAIFHYTRAIDFRKTEDGYLDDNILADLSYNLGICYTDIGSYDKALAMLSEAQEYFNSSKNYQWKAHSSNAIGDIYIKLEDYDKAINNYREALSSLPQLYDGAFDQGLFFSNLANGLYQIGEVDSSKYYVEQSIEIFKKEEMDWGMAFSYGILSKLSNQDKDYITAKLHAETSLAYSTEQGSPSEMSEAHLLMGEAGLRNNELNYALENALLGESISESIGLPKVTMKAKELLAKIYKGKGDAQNTFEYFKAYTELKDSLSNLATQKEIKKAHLNYEIAKRDAELSMQELETAYEKKSRNYLLGGIGGFILLSLILFFGLKKA